MNENLNNEISNLRRNTRNVIRQLNIGKIPTFINVDLVREYSWKQHGFYYSMYTDDRITLYSKSKETFFYGDIG